MKLSELIRKHEFHGVATATSAIHATDDGTSSSKSSICSSSKPQKAKTETGGKPGGGLSREEAEWLALNRYIDESMPEVQRIIDESMPEVQRIIDESMPVVEKFLDEYRATFPDDRITCEQCANLSKGQCLAAYRGEIEASRNYRPVKTIRRRCEGYAPGADDPDKRHGRERWHGLQDVS